MSTAQQTSQTVKMGFDLKRVISDFPILKIRVYGKRLVYLDNAATTHKPQQVLDRLFHLFSNEYSNIHRGVHYLSQVATDGYEKSRETVQKFLNASCKEEIIFLRGTTEAINLVAHSFGKKFIHPGDEILLSQMEHHSNIVPWQMLCEERGAKIRVIPVNQEGEILLAEFEKLLNPRVKLVGIAHVSNALGTINPVKEMVQRAHLMGAKVLVDGAQSVAHLPKIDVKDLGCDFYAFSGHKLYGPNGIGALYGKKELLEQMPPYEGGGDMIENVTFAKTTYADLPNKFEAGTPNIAGAIGLKAAIDYLKSIFWDEAISHEDELCRYATKQLLALPEVSLIGKAKQKTAILSFIIKGIHAHDIGTILDREGIAIRAGHHCAQPLMDFYGIPATARASFGIYNTREDVDALVEGIKKVIMMFK